MTHDEKLAHHLKIKFGLRPGEPNARQLGAIKKHIQSLKDQDIHPTRPDWEYAVQKTAPASVPQAMPV